MAATAGRDAQRSRDQSPVSQRTAGKVLPTSVSDVSVSLFSILNIIYCFLVSKNPQESTYDINQNLKIVFGGFSVKDCDRYQHYE